MSVKYIENDLSGGVGPDPIETENYNKRTKTAIIEGQRIVLHYCVQKDYLLISLDVYEGKKDEGDLENAQIKLRPKISHWEFKKNIHNLFPNKKLSFIEDIVEFIEEKIPNCSSYFIKSTSDSLDGKSGVKDFYAEANKLFDKVISDIEEVRKKMN